MTHPSFTDKLQLILGQLTTHVGDAWVSKPGTIRVTVSGGWVEVRPTRKDIINNDIQRVMHMVQHEYRVRTGRQLPGVHQ